MPAARRRTSASNSDKHWQNKKKEEEKTGANKQKKKKKQCWSVLLWGPGAGIDFGGGAAGPGAPFHRNKCT